MTKVQMGLPLPLTRVVLRTIAIIPLLVLWIPAQTLALDEVIMNRPHNDSDKRLDFSYEMLKLALEQTREGYGDYSFALAAEAMIRDRQLSELLKGGVINVSVSPPKPGWEQAIRVPFPLLRGIASYRLYLINEKNRDIFKNVELIEDIKQKRTGTDSHWSTSVIMQHHKFNLVYGPNYNALFKMLALGRFDVFPRGVNEVFQEVEIQKQSFPRLMLDEYVALYTYLPTYFYVSPSQPRLAKRIEDGLKKAHEDGTLDAIFNRYFGDSIAAARLADRKIFHIDNVNLDPSMYEHDKPYLLKVQ